MSINLNFTNLYGSKKGFTLLEILIAVFILAIVLSTVYAAYRGTFKIIKESEDDSEMYGMARNAMQRIINDLNAVSAAGGKFSFASHPSLTVGVGFIDLTFVSNSHLAFAESESSGGLAKITYYVEENVSGGGYRLMRRDIPYAQGVDDEERQTGFVLCDGLQSLNYKFIDIKGKDHDSWDSSAGLGDERNKVPAIVSIELKLAKDHDRSYMFATKVYLPLSATVYSTLQ